MTTENSCCTFPPSHKVLKVWPLSLLYYIYICTEEYLQQIWCKTVSKHETVVVKNANFLAANSITTIIEYLYPVKPAGDGGRTCKNTTVTQRVLDRAKYFEMNASAFDTQREKALSWCMLWSTLVSYWPSVIQGPCDLAPPVYINTSVH